MKKFILIFSALLLVLPFSVFGAVSYERTPSNIWINLPLTISLTLDTWEDTGCTTLQEPDANYWGIFLNACCGSEGGDYEPQEWIASSTLSYDFTFPLMEIGCQYGEVLLACSREGITYDDSFITLETGEPAFGVIENGANFVPISGNFLASTTAYINDMAVGIFPLLALFVGIPLAFWFLGKVIEIPKKAMKK